MVTEERADERMRRDILDEMGALLRDHLEAEQWGRVLVAVVRREDREPAVADIDVEDIVGDEARIDAAFGIENIGALLPVLAKATEALCGLAGVELDDVGGGTFLRQPDDRETRFEWLPGLVHAPSAAFERARDAAVAELREKRRALEDRFGLEKHERYDVDIEAETITFASGGHARVRGRATLIGTYALASRAWAWGGASKQVPERARAASAALVDGILQPELRGMWELSTPVFAVDEQTAWAIVALVCEAVGGEGVYATRTEEGVVFLLLREVRDVRPSDAAGRREPSPQ
jgi:hypothetical protein